MGRLHQLIKVVGVGRITREQLYDMVEVENKITYISYMNALRKYLNGSNEISMASAEKIITKNDSGKANIKINPLPAITPIAKKLNSGMSARFYGH